MDVNIDKNTHTSVLLEELVEYINIYKDNRNIIVDATLWLAGHASKIVSRMNPGDIFVGFDADERNLKLAKEKLDTIQTETQIILIQSNFADIGERLNDHGITHVTGIYYDLGVSSLHFDEAERWFSLRLEGPLDMRFDTKIWRTAADILNFSEEKEIYNILKEFGEEPHARKVAAKVIEQRKQKKFTTTKELTEFLDEQVNTHIKTKMRVFQALRIAVNNELWNLEKSLDSAIDLLETNGTIFVISFHSLEDRIVKQRLKRESRDCLCSDIICSCKHIKSIKILTKKPILPSKREQENNTRSRSAKARAARKL